ncbi:MAG: acetylxylan esterase [Patescibacteria group bacterium]
MKNKLFILLLIIMAILLIFGWTKKYNQKSLTNIITTTPQSLSSFVLGPGDYNFSLIDNGVERIYKTHVPPNYNKNIKTPVVIYIHGGGGSSLGSKNDGLYNYSDKYGFILLSPAGTGILKDKLLVWNIGTYLINGEIQNYNNYASEHNVNDVDFLSKMINDIKNNFNVDEKRIYATGISQGGTMSYRLACELSDKIAAIAPIAPPVSPANCNPPRNVSIIHIHGTEDPCAPFNGGLSIGCLGTNKELFQSAQEMIEKWRNTNNCLQTPVVTYQNKDATCINYNKCDGNSNVEFCTIKNMGHTYPSGSQYLSAKIIGPVSYDMSFDQIWEFFKNHPME